jgi:hypothetical protein
MRRIETRVTTATAVAAPFMNRLDVSSAAILDIELMKVHQEIQETAVRLQLLNARRQLIERMRGPAGASRPMPLPLPPVPVQVQTPAQMQIQTPVQTQTRPQQQPTQDVKTTVETNRKTNDDPLSVLINASELSSPLTVVKAKPYVLRESQLFGATKNLKRALKVILQTWNTYVQLHTAAPPSSVFVSELRKQRLSSNVQSFLQNGAHIHSCFSEILEVITK